MKFDAVIFDLFGTLVDFTSNEEYMGEQAALAKALGVTFQDLRGAWDATMKDRFVGKFGSVESDFEHILRLLDVAPDRNVFGRATLLYLELTRPRLKPRDGAVELLEKLRTSGYRIGLISGCSSEIPRVWNETPFQSLIDVSLFSCVEHTEKPDPRIYRSACERLGVDPTRCLFVGDGGSRELTGALAVGMHPVLIRVGYDNFMDRHRAEALEWKGDTITHLSEVIGLLGEAAST